VSWGAWVQPPLVVDVRNLQPGDLRNIQLALLRIALQDAVGWPRALANDETRATRPLGVLKHTSPQLQPFLALLLLVHAVHSRCRRQAGVRVEGVDPSRGVIVEHLGIAAAFDAAGLLVIQGVEMMCTTLALRTWVRVMAWGYG
jgi:hypothetical protein